MSTKLRKVKTVKSAEGQSIKPALGSASIKALPHSTFDLEDFKKSLIRFSDPQVTGKSDQIRSREYSARIEVLRGKQQLLRAINSLPLVEGLNAKSIVESSLKELTRYIFLKQRMIYPKKRRGRPQVNGRVALILLSALEANKRNRHMIDEIGKFIEPNGEYQNRIDQRYGEGTYTQLNIPSVNFYKGRWDAHVKSQLKPAAKKVESNIK
jgi:hypothetical protein